MLFYLLLITQRWLATLWLSDTMTVLCSKWTFHQKLQSHQRLMPWTNFIAGGYGALPTREAGRSMFRHTRGPDCEINHRCRPNQVFIYGAVRMYYLVSHARPNQFQCRSLPVCATESNSQCVVGLVWHARLALPWSALSLTSHTLRRERKGLVTLQPSSCPHDKNLMWPIRSVLSVVMKYNYVTTCLADVSILLPNRYVR